MDSDYSTLCNELENIFLECPIDPLGHAKLQDLIDAFCNKYGKDKTKLRTIISNKLDPQGYNTSISRSHFKQLIWEWVTLCNSDERNHTDSSVTSDRPDVFEYETASCAHSTPLGRYRRGFRKIPSKKLFNSPSMGSTPNLIDNQILGFSSNEESQPYRVAAKTHNSSLENSLVKAEHKIYSLEKELKEFKLNSMKEIERYKDENDRLRTYEKLHVDSIHKNDEYEKTLNNLTKEYNKLKCSKDNLDKDYANLETEYHRMQNEVDAKSISLKSLENYKRIQVEEMLVLRESRDILEKEVQKLKAEIKCYCTNEESLLNRIGDLQFEKQNLQVELNELNIFEKLRIVSSSPFGKSALNEDQLMDGTDENRESGVSMRSELMDSLGFSSCIHDTLHQPCFSLQNFSDDSMRFSATEFNFVTERIEKVEKVVQTEKINETRIEKCEVGMQTTGEIRPERSDKGVQIKIQESRPRRSDKGVQIKIHKARPQCNEKGIQTLRMYERRTEKAEKEIQTEKIKETRDISVRSSEDGTDHQVDSRCFNSRDPQGNVGCNAFDWSYHALDISLDRLTPTKLEIDSSLEELHRIKSDFLPHGRIATEEWNLNYEKNGSFRRASSSSILNVDNDAACNSSVRSSCSTYDLVPVLKVLNMSTPQIRLRRLESRRLSCSDIHNEHVTFSGPDTYQNLKFTKKISTVLGSILYFISLGARLCEEGSFDSIIDRLLAERRSKSNIWICMKTSLILLAVALLFFLFVGMFIFTRRHEFLQQLFRPYLELKYPDGPPPT